MRKLFFILISCVLSFANEDSFINMKKCEKIPLSTFTAIVSCHQVDYLVEYRVVEDEETDSVKRVTVITKQKQSIIKDLGH